MMVGLILLFFARVALAADCSSFPNRCDPAATNPTLSRAGLHKPDPCYCPWDVPYRTDMQKLDDDACFETTACTLTAAGSFNGTGGASTAPCKTGTSLPGTCSEGQCFQDTDSASPELYWCTATNTWTAVGGGGGSGDITDVWGCTTGNCNAITGASGDTLDAGSADAISPATRSTSLPGTCTEGRIHQDTDSGGSELYVCTATDTWTKLADTTGGTGDITDVWSVTTGNVNALTAAAGDSLDAGSADASSPTTRSTSLPGTCTEGQWHQDTDSGGSESYVCTATNTWLKVNTIRTHATDCTALTDGTSGELCYELDANSLYACDPTSGGCDTAGEWIQLVNPGSGTGDITDVFGCTSGNCSALTAASGDSLDMGSGDSAKPCLRGTSLPGTCAVGDCFQDTDATASAQFYLCTATNTWTAQGGGGGGNTSPTGIWLPAGGFPINSNTQVQSTTGRCMDFVPLQGIENATKLAWGLTGSGTFTCGAAIYTADGTTQLATSGGVSCNAGSSSPTTATGLTAFTLNAGTEYRYAWCASGAVGSYLGANVSVSASTADQTDIINAFVTNIGTCSSACSSGTPQSTTGTVTADGTFRPLLLYVSKE